MILDDIFASIMILDDIFASHQIPNESRVDYRERSDGRNHNQASGDLAKIRNGILSNRLISGFVVLTFKSLYICFRLCCLDILSFFFVIGDLLSL